METSQLTATKKQDEPTLAKQYLVCYNGFLSIGFVLFLLFYLVCWDLYFYFSWSWLIILLKTLGTIVEYRSLSDLLTSKNLYKDIEFPLKVVQSLAFLDVLHALIKLVKTNAFLSLIQTSGKLISLWLIIDKFEPVSNDAWLNSFNWSIS